MLENCKSAKERWGGVSNIIDRWLQERQEMLVRYCSLTAIPAFDESDREQCEKIQQLCQIMMDYVSAGHFEVYDQLVKEGKEFNDEAALDRANRLYSQVEATTDSILDFNDKYQETDDLSSLPEDLSFIGEQLENRFEAEDGMISILHVAHKELVA
ncbi:sigma D regulator [Gilvimarinus sp. F26214L]|uniref:sigma D regulator n=1 Tax=Gilvimarinus sp. DZF01 TaxID=3461371 RepID=UPI00404657E1